MNMPTKSALLWTGLLILVTGCGSSGPASTIKNFVSLIEKGNVTEAAKLINAPPGMEAKLSMGLSVATQELSKDGGLDFVEIVKEDEQGATAHVTYIVHTKSEKSGGTKGDKTNASLIMSDGAWKLNILGS